MSQPSLERARERYIRIGEPDAEAAAADAEEPVGWMAWIWERRADV